MRGKGEGAIFRVPKDRKQPLKYWQASVELPSHDGTRRRVILRKKNKTELIELMEEKKKELRARGDLPTKSQTTQQWFTYWLEQIVVKEVRPKTVGGYRSVVNGHIIPTIGSVKLDKVTPAHIRRVHDRIIEKGLSSTYALNAHRVMSASFEIALREGRIGRNPAKLTTAPRKAVAALDVLDLAEGMQVLEHVAKDPLMGARWATALLTGARRGEVLGLERDRVTDVLDLSWQLQRLAVTDKIGVPDVPADFEYRHLTGGLYLTRPKSSAGWRIVPLVEPLKSILNRYLDATEPNHYGLVFTTNGNPIDPDQDTANWRRVLKTTGIQKDVRLHDLRHTAVDMLYLAGVPEDLIMEIVGHSTRAVTRGYKARANRERLTAAMEQMSALFTRPDGENLDTPEAIDQ
jgi:integrase